MRCTESIEAGAYVLGALSPAERSAYQRHIATCLECREEVADLAGLPGLLGRLDEATAAGLSEPGASPAPPPALLSNVLDKVRLERARSHRRRRWQSGGLAAAAACLALLVGLGVSVLGTPESSAMPQGVVLATMDAVQAGEPIAAVLGYQESGGGTDIYMGCIYEEQAATGEETFQLTVYFRGGGDVHNVLLQWHTAPGEYKTIEAHAGRPPKDIDRIVVQRTSDGRDLLSYRVT